MFRLNLRGGFGIPGAVTAPVTSTGFGVPTLAIAIAALQKQIDFDNTLKTLNDQIDRQVLPEYRPLTENDKNALKEEAYKLYLKRLDDVLVQNRDLETRPDQLREIIKARSEGLNATDLDALYKKFGSSLMGIPVPTIAPALTALKKQMDFDNTLIVLLEQIDKEILPEYRGLAIDDKNKLKNEAYDLYLKRLEEILVQNFNLGKSKEDLRAIIMAKGAGIKTDDLQALYKKFENVPARENAPSSTSYGPAPGSQGYSTYTGTYQNPGTFESLGFTSLKNTNIEVLSAMAPIAKQYGFLNNDDERALMAAQSEAEKKKLIHLLMQGAATLAMFIPQVGPAISGSIQLAEQFV